MARKASSKPSDSSTATIGFEAKLWLTADKLRNNMDAAEYKHVVLGLIFLKYISDTFEEHRAKLIAGKGDYAGANPEDPDEYKAKNVFWVPAEARWTNLQANAKLPTIGKIVDDAMVAFERDNPRLKGVLLKDYARPGLDKHRLGELIDLIATISLTAASEGEKTHRSVDLLGRVYECFLTRFISAEGKNGGQPSGARQSANDSPQGERGAVHQFYTAPRIVRCLVEMLAHSRGRIYDPDCGSGGSLPASRLCGVRFAEKDRAISQGIVRSEKFVESHGGTAPRDSVFSEGKRANISIYGQESNPNTRRSAIMNLANGSMSSNQSGEGEIRKSLIEADLVDCMVALPGRLFYSTQIPVCLWFLTKNEAADAKRGFRVRRKQSLFINTGMRNPSLN